MKYFIFTLLFALIFMTGCQTANINHTKYKTSPATTELGSIGHGKSFFNVENDFKTKSYPVLQNKLRLDIQILPFNRRLNKIYEKKFEKNQVQPKIAYIDSLPIKPEFVTVSISDMAGYANEINQPYNKSIITYLEDTKETVVVTRIALSLPTEQINKLRDADTYYLVNDQDKKYTVALYKEGKQIDVIDLQSGTVLAYKLGRFCWGNNNRGQWYIADIVEDAHGCKGTTKDAVEEKKETNLFKM